jgi:phosphoglucosamine mutase
VQTKPQLFGTDGVRGIAGRFPLDPGTVTRLGWALGRVLQTQGGSEKASVLLGRDTRESSPWIARALAAGLGAQGARVAFAGIVTTPGLAFLTRHYSFSAGVMVSASHNPFEDNGIKVLSSAGTKLPENLELEIERGLGKASLPGERIPEIDLRADPAFLEAYLAYLAASVPADDHISKFRLAVDCAHGAASVVVPPLLKRLGMRASILNAEPNGRNINLAAGSLYPEAVAAETQSTRADVGVAFDGDADRSIFASPHGRICDGDYVLFAMAPFLKAQNRLKGSAVVGTLMSNLGLEMALENHGIGLKRASVGDKFVLEEMLRSGINLGGEPSGHIIFSDISLAGDGVVTLLQMLRLLSERAEPIDEIMRDYRPFPQRILNVRVRGKPPLESLPGVARALARCREQLGDRGRVVVRYSGTEPLARVMVEGEKADRVEHHAAEIADVIKRTVGASGSRG